jgi:hypothetical protein
MLDPVAVRSYLSSLGQQQGGAAQGGGVQAMLANLRQRLYGQAQGGMNQTPGINPNAGGGPFGKPTMETGGSDPAWTQTPGINPGMPNKPDTRPPVMDGKPTLAGPPMAQTPGINPNADGGQFMPNKPTMRPPAGPIFQAEPGQPQKPAWQQLREAGMQGTGSAAGNRAAASGIGGQPQIASVPMPQAGRPMRQGGVMDIQGAGIGNSGGFPAGGADMGGPGSDMGFQSGGGFMAGDGAGQPQFQSGGPFMSEPLPMGDGGPAPGLQFQSGGGLMAPPAPGATKPPITAGPPASPAVLGTQQFQGPNARRINAARQGIFNNVRQALRRPVAGGGKVGMR